MVRRPWEWTSKPVSDREYLVLLSYLPLQRFRTMPGFLRHVRAIQRQLRGTKGLLGYSFDAHPLARRSWTLSVWEDEGSLMEFVRTGSHLGTMGALRGKMGRTMFVRWKAEGSEIPPSWDGALARQRSEEAQGGATPPPR
jgi:hypothetical protein